MKKFKHKITGEIAEQTVSKSSYSVNTPSAIFFLPNWTVENTHDWEEINSYPIGTRIFDTIEKFYHIKGEHGWYVPNMMSCGVNESEIGEGERFRVVKEIFITEDGVPIYERDTWWSVYDDKYCQEQYRWSMWERNYRLGRLDLTKPGIHRFSTKEKAEEYLSINKPRFSIMDIGEIVGNKSFIGKDYLIEKMKEYDK